MEVVLGAHEIHEDEPTQQSIISEKFIIHKGWSPLLLTADIAVIELPTDIEFNGNPLSFFNYNKTLILFYSRSRPTTAFAMRVR